MLNLVDTTIEKIFAQEKLEARLQKAWREQEKRVVVWRPDSRRITVHHNSRYWYVWVTSARPEGGFDPPPLVPLWRISGERQS